MTAPTARWARLDAAAVLALILAVGAVHQAWGRYRGSDAIDFYQFWLVGQAAGEVRDPYSSGARRALGEAGFRAAEVSGSPGQRAAAERRRVLDTTATPLLYASFRVLASGDYELDYALFRLLGIASTCAAVLLLCAVFGWPPAAALLALAVVLVSPPCTADAVVGNVNQMQLAGLALLVALLRAPEKRWTAPASGAVAALLVLFKPNLALAEALLVAGFFLRGRTRFAAAHLAGAAAAALAAFAASSALFGTASVWTSWMGALAELDRGAPLPLSKGNVSVARLLPDPLRSALAAALVAATVAALWRGRRRGSDFAADVAAAGAGVCISLVAAALAWEHYYLLATPFVLAFLAPGAARPTFAAGCAAAALLWLLPSLTSRELAALVGVELATGALVLLAASVDVLRGRNPPTSIQAAQRESQWPS